MRNCDQYKDKPTVRGFKANNWTFTLKTKQSMETMSTLLFPVNLRKFWLRTQTKPEMFSPRFTLDIGEAHGVHCQQQQLIHLHKRLKMKTFSPETPTWWSLTIATQFNVYSCHGIGSLWRNGSRGAIREQQLKPNTRWHCGGQTGKSWTKREMSAHTRSVVRLQPSPPEELRKQTLSYGENKQKILKERKKTPTQDTSQTRLAFREKIDSRHASRFVFAARHIFSIIE